MARLIGNKGNKADGRKRRTDRGKRRRGPKAKKKNLRDQGDFWGTKESHHGN